MEEYRTCKTSPARVGLSLPDTHDLRLALGCRLHDLLYFGLHPFQDTHINGSLDLFVKLLYEFSDVLRNAFYVQRFSDSRTSFFRHEWPPLWLAKYITTKLIQVSRASPVYVGAK